MTSSPSGAAVGVTREATLRHHANESLEEQEFLLRASSPAPGAMDSPLLAGDGLTKIRELLKQCGYNFDETHPECYRNFSYVKFFELIASPQDVGREATVSRDSRHCPNGVEHGNCLYPDCVSSCPGRPSASARDAVIDAINGYVHDLAADPPFTLEKYRAGILKAAIRSLAQGDRS